jgi:anti-sigma regulatory factor (Ser/Thr protein kinase)
VSATSEALAEPSYRHEAFLYGSRDEFMEGTLQFIRDAVVATEPILIVLNASKIEAIRGELGDEDGVSYADMGAVGTNPARIIPAWLDFVERHRRPGRRLRGIGESVCPARTPAELTECQRHDALLNFAFADSALWLLCPYDTQALDASVIDEARRGHPFVREHGVLAASRTFAGVDALAAPFAEPLLEPPADTLTFEFKELTLPEVRTLVEAGAARAGLSRTRTAELVLAAHEVATNSIRHGGGHGALRLWLEPEAVVVEIRDDGRITDALVGRTRPAVDAESGRGLWIANQLCELVQVRSFAHETVIRLHMRRP